VVFLLEELNKRYYALYQSLLNQLGNNSELDEFVRVTQQLMLDEFKKYLEEMESRIQ
jgi:hypothetical protein